LVVYTDNGDIRTFDNPNEDDLVGHRDKENRMIEVLEGENWEIQYEDELPILMFVGDEFYIPKMVFHRLHKGNDKLVIKINK
jgi:UDP-2,3-diacylglucosamine pyrophosphatase LpxH